MGGYYYLAGSNLSSMPLFTDQLGRTLSLDRPPQRIISLVPSQTELLYTLGLEEEVVGITKFCIHPEQWFRHKTRIGGTKDIRPEIIHSLQPDLVLANKEENDRTQIEELFPKVPVWVSDVATLADALQMIRSVGQLTGKAVQAESLASAIARRFAGLEAPESPRASLRTAYFIWRKPWMVAGGDTFIQDMLFRAGFTNIFRDQPRYPSIELESLAGSDCELVLLSSEPYPFREKHIGEIREVLPRATIRLVDGEIFSWYGSRLLQAPAYLRELRSWPQR
jgi:ABC-type Fe3+-hydroxamate transport system substrate-binding protein